MHLAPSLLFLNLFHVISQENGKHKNVPTYVHNSISNKRQEVDTSQTFMSGRVAKQNVVYPYNGVLLGHKKEVLVQHGCPLKTSH